jgi:1-acyl-sn-glycerol-3-phosphate acyltransferase
MLIAKAKVPVVPVRVQGAHLALPKDSRLPRPATVKIVFGPRWEVDLSSFSGEGKVLYQNLSDEVMRRIGQLHPVS